MGIPRRRISIELLFIPLKILITLFLIHYNVIYSPYSYIRLGRMVIEISLRGIIKKLALNAYLEV